MKRVAINKPVKVKYFQSYPVPNATLVANKGDFAGRKYWLFGKKQYFEYDMWDFGALAHRVPATYEKEYCRIGDTLYHRPELLLVYGENWYDEFFFETNEKAEKEFENLSRKFGLIEINYGHGTSEM